MQVGYHHVNMHENAYIIARMEERGFTYDKTMSEDAREKFTLWWLSNTFMIFRRNK